MEAFRLTPEFPMLRNVLTHTAPEARGFDPHSYYIRRLAPWAVAAAKTVLI